MMYLFDQSELLKCRNVYGRVSNQPLVKPKPEEALDEKRVAMIRRLVEEVGASDNRVWSLCVKAMNKKICNLKTKAAQG